jgi:hypothetical protein
MSVRFKDSLRRGELRAQKRQGTIKVVPEEFIRCIAETSFGVVLTDAQVRCAQSRGGDEGAVKYAIDAV